MSGMDSSIKSESVGIGGWLILPAIICVIAPVANTYGGIDAFVSAARVQARYRSVVYLDGMLSFVLAALWLACGYLMLKHHRLFPTLFMALLAAGVCRVLLMAFMLGVHGANISPLGAAFANTFTPALIWIPYMLMSKRVASTFIRE
jgi:hypothetical protein